MYKMSEITFNWIVNFALFLLKWQTGYDWIPDMPVPPDPEPEVPDWVKRFGDLSRYSPLYAKTARKAFYQVSAEKAPVFFETSRYVKDDHIKVIFENRTSESCPELLAPKEGVVIVGYKEKIPNSTATSAPIYADSRTVIEICDPLGGVIWPEHVDLIGWLDDDGNYIDVNYTGL